MVQKPLLLVEGDDAAGNGLTDGVDLRHVAAALDADLEVERSPLADLAVLALAEHEEGLVDWGE